MALVQLQWFSPTLGMHMVTWALLPNNAKPPYATLYLLHGLSDDGSIWTRRTRLELHAEKYLLAIVMPTALRGFYTHNDKAPDFAKYIAEDVVQSSERFLPLKADRKARAIGGLSMGGYGALRVGLARPDLFSSIHSHSGALLGCSEGTKVGDIPDAEWIFGPKRYAGSQHDLLVHAKAAKKAGNLPKIRIDCGKEDFLIEVNRKVHGQLQRAEIPHEYDEYPGTHNWEYWDTHIQTALAFHAKYLRL